MRTAASTDVNSVGSILLRPAHMTKVDFDATVRQNLRTAFAAVHAGAGARKAGEHRAGEHRCGAHGLSNHEAIAAAKAGVQGPPCRGDLRPAGCPGELRRAGARGHGLAAPIVGSERALEFPRGARLQRIGQPEVASAIEWLLDPAQSWVTGQVLGVDGGLHRPPAPNHRRTHVRTAAPRHPRRRDPALVADLDRARRPLPARRQDRPAPTTSTCSDHARRGAADARRALTAFMLWADPLGDELGSARGARPLGIVWLETGLFAVPQHGRLEAGFDP